MEFWLQQNSDKFQLPVKPSDYTVSVAHKNTVVNVIQVGDVNLIGNTGLREISLKSFFPAKDYNFSNNAGRKQPLTYVEKIESWRKSGTPIRVIITGTLNMEATQRQELPQLPLQRVLQNILAVLRYRLW